MKVTHKVLTIVLKLDRKSGITRADGFTESEKVRSYSQVLVLCQVYGIE